jgi:hypothetical protein
VLHRQARRPISGLPFVNRYETFWVSLDPWFPRIGLVSNSQDWRLTWGKIKPIISLDPSEHELGFMENAVWARMITARS